jgi:very-short-patch-repair endonuclease
MGRSILQRAGGETWALIGRQHGVVTRRQLLELGLSGDAVDHRIATARLHPVMAGVYAVGRPGLSQRGSWMAAVLACGSAAVLSHDSAAALWRIRSAYGSVVAVTVPPSVCRRRPGISTYRRSLEPDERTEIDRIPVTSIHRTLLDIAAQLRREDLEAAINAADKHGLTTPPRLRAALADYAARPGVAVLRAVLDRRTFVLTDSQLERRFLPIARRAGLPRPRTGRRLNGFKVDFHWPELGLVLETDGLRYHRTPAQQARDRLRDQAHTAAGLTPLRFTHAQVRYEPDHVEQTLSAVVERLKDLSVHRPGDPSTGADDQVETVSAPSSSEIATSSE